MNVLFFGGAANGKSTLAETLLSSLPGPRYYVAAMRPEDAEGWARVARHRAMRAQKGFVTLEKYTDLASLRLPARGSVLLECLCNLTANEMFAPNGDMRDPVPAVLAGVAALGAQAEHLLVVTNDVGSDGEPYPSPVMAYIRALGQVNRALAARFPNVIELVCGVPRSIKGELPMGLHCVAPGQNGKESGMILIIGGRGAGKRAYAQSLGFTDADMADGVLDARPVLCNLQDLVARIADPEALLPELLTKRAVLCDEVGSGIVPLDRAARRDREATGRLCVLLGASAARVVRLVCGVPVILKDRNTVVEDK